MKEKVKPYYEELKGMRDAMPETGWFEDIGISAKYHKTLESISSIYPEFIASDYKVKQEWQENQFGNGGRNMITKDHYFTNLNAAIGYLRGSFEFDSTSSGNGHTFIQNQTMSIEIVLGLHEKIIKAESNYLEGSPERTFLQKLKSALSSVKDASDIVKMVLIEAQKAGLTLDKLTSIFQ